MAERTRHLFTPSGRHARRLRSRGRARRSALSLLALLIVLLCSATCGAARQFDVVVYGGTAGGVMTAVAAAREGASVALLEPGTHLGGMVSGGLGRTDFGKKEVIG